MFCIKNCKDGQDDLEEKITMKNGTSQGMGTKINLSNIVCFLLSKFHTFLLLPLTIL